MTPQSPARHEELKRQRLILLREMPERVALTTLAIALCAMFANPWALAAALLVYLLAEVAGPWMQDPDRMERSTLWYGAAMAQSVVVEAAYMAAAGLVWQDDDAFSKAFATGMAAMTLMHLATVRAIHLPSGLAGLTGAALAALVANTLYWLEREDLVGLAMSTTAAFGALAYTLTAMLSNHRLHRSMAAEEAAARAAKEAKSLFLAQMSHELRTPLNAIIGMAQSELADVTRSQTPDSQRCDRVGLILNNARTLASILDDVTDLNASDHARLQLRLRTVDLCAEVTAVVDAFRERAERLEVPFRLDCLGEAPGRVRIDAVRLRQCIGNLLSNALRHAAGGAVTATARVTPDAEGGGMLVMDISDTGPGVPEDKRETIFQAFERGRAAAPGTGLGLSISRTLARLMGGDIVLVPGPVGATFRLTARYLPPGPDLPDAAPPDLAGKRVLVVDDIATNRLVAATYLRTWGAQVIEAESGAVALSILANEDIDLMLIDMNMPGLNGLETIRRARMTGGSLAALPIVAMTADVLEDQVAATRSAGADGHVPKPLLPEVLAAEMRRLL